MPPPHLYIIHPALERMPHLLEWLGSVENLLRSEVAWNEWSIHRIECDLQAKFDVPTQSDRIRRFPGSVIAIQKVRAADLGRLEAMLKGESTVYKIAPACSEDIWIACESARASYLDGHPLISLRELVAYLIICKLIRYKMWGGESLNKNFMWSDDLPKGGFPKEVVESRVVVEVADVLYGCGILSRKESQGQYKYASRRCSSCECHTEFEVI